MCMESLLLFAENLDKGKRKSKKIGIGTHGRTRAKLIRRNWVAPLENKIKRRTIIIRLS